MAENVLSPENIVLVTDGRISKAERRDGLYYYDVRHSDECGMTPASIRDFVLVNHMCTIALLDPLDFTEDTELELTERDEGLLTEGFFA